MELVCARDSLVVHSTACTEVKRINSIEQFGFSNRTIATTFSIHTRMVVIRCSHAIHRRRKVVACAFPSYRKSATSPTAASHRMSLRFDKVCSTTNWKMRINNFRLLFGRSNSLNSAAQRRWIRRSMLSMQRNKPNESREKRRNQTRQDKRVYA